MEKSKPQRFEDDIALGTSPDGWGLHVAFDSNDLTEEMDYDPRKINPKDFVCRFIGFRDAALRRLGGPNSLAFRIFTNLIDGGYASADDFRASQAACDVFWQCPLGFAMASDDPTSAEIWSDWDASSPDKDPLGAIVIPKSKLTQLGVFDMTAEDAEEESDYEADLLSRWLGRLSFDVALETPSGAMAAVVGPIQFWEKEDPAAGYGFEEIFAGLRRSLDAALAEKPKEARLSKETEDALFASALADAKASSENRGEPDQKA